MREPQNLLLALALSVPVLASATHDASAAAPAASVVAASAPRPAASSSSAASSATASSASSAMGSGQAATRGAQGQAGPIDDDNDGQLPAGHPATGAPGAPGGAPHGQPGGGGGGPPGAFQPPPDLTEEAQDLPPGAILVSIVDAAGKPIPNAAVTLGIVNNSIAKGESRKRIPRTANAQGEVRFDHLETESQVAYRVTAPVDGATFAATPFRLPEQHGMRVKLHVYPVTHDVEQAVIVSQATLYVELKDDRVQIQEAFTVWNFGSVTWVPENAVIPLPNGFTGFAGQQGMTDTGVDSVDKVGVRLRGTFAPGRHDIEFRWQLPYDGETQVLIDAGMPPHLATARAMAPASRQMAFSATGFPPAVSRMDGQGQRILITEKQLGRGEPPMRALHVELRDLPGQGPGRYVATSLTAFGIVTGIALALQGRTARDRRSQSRKKDQKELRKELLAELVQLEEAHKRGDVGPQTYARARRELIDQIALTFAPATSGATSGTAPQSAASS